MPALTAPALVAAALLALAGGQKLLDPTMTVGALRALRVPASPLAVRVGSAAELALGVGAITIGGAVVWWLVAASYLAFTGFVALALRSGTMIGSCGCFGREETPPHPVHLGVNVVLAATAVATAVAERPAPLESLLDEPGLGAAVVGLSALAAYLVFAAFVVLPRALARRTIRTGH